jgi:Zn-dependent membrane protease YugP
MECLIQYLDEIEDAFYAIALVTERIRRGVQFTAILAISLLLQILGVMLALSQPALALGAVALMSVGLLYRAVTGPTHYRPQLA